MAEIDPFRPLAFLDSRRSTDEAGRRKMWAARLCLRGDLGLNAIH
jgi:hypothetical protein